MMMMLFGKISSIIIYMNKIDFKFNSGEFKSQKIKDDTNFDSRFNTKKETLLKHKKPKYKNNNYVEIVVDMISTSTGNRWGSFVVKGGTDNITAYQPLTIIAYSFTSSTSRVY
mgnify:CR=1 FL=1